MARAEVDDLFAGEDAPKPRTRRVDATLALGVIVAILGLACTSAVGGVIVLFAWMMAEKELERVESGYLPPDARPAVQRLRQRTWVALGLIVAIFLLQGVVLCTTDWYQSLWNAGLEAALSLTNPDPASLPAP